MSSAIESNSTSETFTNGEVRHGHFFDVDFTSPMYHCLKENVIKEEKKEEEVLIPIVLDIKDEESIKIKLEEDTNGNARTLVDQSFILEGKRSRKPTLRLEMSESTPIKKEFVIPQVNSLFSSTPEMPFSFRRVMVHHWVKLNTVSHTLIPSLAIEYWVFS